MDVQIALLSAGVCLISAVVVYLISVFGFREKTYEEAIEDQRKRNQEVSQNTKLEKPKKEKKFKKPNKRSKESRNSEEEIDPVGGFNHINDRVEFKPDAEIIPVDPDADIKPSKSKKKMKTPKSILLNKQEVGPIAAALPTNIDDDEDSSRHDSLNGFVSIEELERRESLDIGKKKLATLLQNTETFPEIEIAETKTCITELSAHPSEVHEIFNEKTTDEPTKKDKKHSEGSDKESEINFKKLLGTINKQSLRDEEIQSLVEILLSKHQGDPGWKKKNDLLASLKTQLAEKEASLEGEQHNTQAANVKLQEMQQELALEKSQSCALEQNLRQELAAAHVHMQAAIKQQAALQESHSKTIEEQVLNMQRLNEENVSLQKQLQLMEVEGHKWAAHERELQRELEERYQASLVQEQECMNLQLQAKELQLQQIIAAQQEGDFQCSQAVVELKQQLQESKCQQATFSQKVDAERSSVRHRFEEKEMILQKQDEDLQTFKRIAEEERLKLQGHVDLLQEQLKNAVSQLQDHGHQLDMLRDEAESLHHQLVSAHEQKESIEALGNSLTAQLQEEINLLKTRLVELEVMVEQSQKDLTNAQNELETQTSKNNELRKHHWEAMDTLNALEMSSKEREESQAKALVLVQQQKEEALAELQQQHQQFQDQLQQKQEEGISDVQLQRIQEEEKLCLQRVLPEGHLDISLEHSVWLESFVEHVQQQLATAGTLEGENSSLAVQVNHYQTVLADTEKMLKNLQMRVEDQESLWAEQLARKDEETQKVLQEKAALEQILHEQEGTNEARSRLAALQDKLQTEQNDRKEAECKVKEAQQECAALTIQLENKSSEVERLQKEMETTQRLNSYMDNLHKELEKERKSSKELGSQVVKLNSLVKIGEDALRAEQALVMQLQAQISPCSNGNNNISNHHNNNNGSHDTACTNNKIPADNGTEGEHKIPANNSAAAENKPSGKPARTDKPNKSKKRGASGKK